MTKKKALILILVGEVVIYLFLLVGLPLFKNWLYSYIECTGGRDLGMPMWIIYPIPLLIGGYMALIIWQKKEAKQ